MKRIRMAPVYVALILVCLLFLFPFYWVLISGLKSVAGLNLEPPSMYPSEQLTIQLTAQTQGRMYSGNGMNWLKLAPSTDLLGGNAGPGAYYLEIDGEKPTQLVSWFADSAVKPKLLKGASLKLADVPVHQVGNGRVGVLAKMVRQNANGFDELLMSVPAASGELGAVSVLKDVSHREIRYFSAHWENFAKAMKGPEASIGGTSTGFALFMRNSLFIACMAVLGQILSSSLVAFGFSRMHFRGREVLFIVLIATLMVPAQVTLIPLFTIYKSVGWIDSFLPLIVPQFTAGAFNVFLIRQFMLGFPKELDESAEIDGATPFRIFRSVIFPNCGPVLIVVGLFTFVAAWQDVMGPLIYLDSPQYRTVSLGLEYFRSPYVDNRPLLMAGALLSMLPVAALFLVAQRYIMSGIATTGLKG